MYVLQGQSHPTRVRGLKPPKLAMLAIMIVAPHTGAWIETRNIRMGDLSDDVAPHTGAWIETRLLIVLLD